MTMVRRGGRTKRIHTKKWQRCVRDVSKQKPKVKSPYAICTESLGKKSFLKRPVKG